MREMSGCYTRVPGWGNSLKPTILAAGIEGPQAWISIRILRIEKSRFRKYPARDRKVRAGTQDRPFLNTRRFGVPVFSGTPFALSVSCPTLLSAIPNRVESSTQQGFFQRLAQKRAGNPFATHERGSLTDLPVPASYSSSSVFPDPVEKILSP